MKEILGKNLQNMFENKFPDSKRTYSGNEFDIWEISDETYEAISDMTDDEFYNLCPYGEWYFALGSNMGEPDVEYIINEQTIKAWDGEQRLSWVDDECVDCTDYLDEHCLATDSDVCDCFNERKYYSLTDYLSYEISVGLLKNVCALAVDLAKYNNMTLAELFTKYEGSVDNGQ